MAGKREIDASGMAGRRSATNYEAEESAHGDGGQLAEWAMNQEDDGSGYECDQAPDDIRGEGAHHPEDRLRDYRDGDKLKSVNDAGTQTAVEQWMALRESKHK